MKKLSITTAWNETVAFVKREAQLLLPLAFLLLALPMALLQLVMPQAEEGQMPPFGAWVGVFLLAVVATMVGNIALSFLALRPGTSVGDALGRGLRRFLPLLGAGILAGLVAGMLFFLAAMIAAVLVPGSAAELASGEPNPESLGAITLMTLIALPFLLFIAVRLLLMTAVAAAEDGGPIAIIRRSWQLTSGHFWRLLGFLVLIVILLMVVSMAVGAVIGLLVLALAGPPEPGSAGFFIMILVSAVVNTVVSLLLVTMIARIYAQLAQSGVGAASAFTPEI